MTQEKEALENLKKRVEQFNALELPGQPMGMHMGTAYLVGDLMRALLSLSAERKEVQAQYDTLRVNWDALCDKRCQAECERDRMREALNELAEASEQALKMNQDDGDNFGGGWWTMREVNAIAKARAALAPSPLSNG